MYNEPNTDSDDKMIFPLSRKDFSQKLLLSKLTELIKMAVVHTVKLARAKILATAPRIMFRRQKEPRIRAKISAGNDCLRFPQVTGGKLAAPAGTLGETFIVRVRADFSKSKDNLFDQSQTI